MKIGILTLPIAENYGGILQAVALYQLLERQGHDVTLIYKAHSRSPFLVKEVIRKILLAIPGHNLFNVKVTKQNRIEWAQRRDLHLPFIQNEISKISPTLKTTAELKQYAHEKQFDAVIVGSDQVWRKAYIDDPYYKSYFLDFIPTQSNTKKIAYAASFGKDYWEGQGDSATISKLLSDFDGISVREASGIDICKNTFNVNGVQHVLDPTLLMGKEFYLEMIAKYDLTNISPKKIVTYVLDENDTKKTIIEKAQQNFACLDDDIAHLRGFNKENKTYTLPEWLCSIANADFVITDSFHGMVFSIIFEKQFVVIGNHNRGLERFTSLLNMLQLEERLISINPEATITESIDYKRVNQLLRAQQANSEAFLTRALS